MRVLVVDDEPNIRLLMSVILQELDCEVITVDNGQAALAEVRRCAPDLMFLDLRMPKMGGVQVLSELRADPRFAHLPIVVVSGSGEVEESFDVRAADELLIKPFDVEQLLLTARRYLSDERRESPVPSPSHG